MSVDVGFLRYKGYYGVVLAKTKESAPTPVVALTAEQQKKKTEKAASKVVVFFFFCVFFFLTL
jgi:hypothetical protein